MGSQSVPFLHWGSWWQENHFVLSLFAGAASGITAETVLFPVDCLKTRLQSPVGFSASGGFSSLYAGLRPAVFGCAPSSAIFFCTYEWTADALKEHPGAKNSPPQLAIASILGELTACVVRTPTEFVKQRCQVGQACSFAHAIADLRSARVSGLLWSSFKATAYRDVCFSGLQFPLYEFLKAKACGHHPESLSMVQAALCGSVSGMCSGFLTTPLDKCKTQLMLQGNSAGPSSILFAMRETYVQGGLRAVFKGGAARTVWMGFGGLIFLGAYELFKDLLAGKKTCKCKCDAQKRIGGTAETPALPCPSKSQLQSDLPPEATLATDVFARRTFLHDGPSLDQQLSMQAALAAGGIAGVCVDFPLHPLETIKTRMQAPEGFRAAGGCRGLWSGLTPVLLASVPTSSAFFVTYQCVLRTFDGIAQRSQGGFGASALEAMAAAAAEVSAVSLRVPSEVLKQRIQVGQHPSFCSALNRIYVAEGFAGFYVGFHATVMRELPFTMLQMTVFEALKRRHPWAPETFREGAIGVGVESLTVGTTCGAVAGGLAGALTTPLDLVKTRIMLSERPHDGSCRRYSGLVATLWTIFSEEGLAALFRGLVPRTCVSAAGGAIWLGSFDIISTLLTAPAS
ncbi:unnamed protein product [Polarella glacialis]|uniref:Mitochondrial carrier protein n=1 Tax=Polarella glacialis TaxID=89957 RepID=A0A813FJD6_POLGL|nr:unnamed protein product [Polarella glacialis]CAE8718069.1 unnamed protein product [Polarella glacialis]